MTKYMKRKYSKGMAMIGWVLLVAFTISASLLVTNWARQRTETMTESTVKYVEGRLACQSVRLANISTACQTNQVTLKNIGILNIDRMTAQIDDQRSETKPIDLKARGDAKTITLDGPFNKAKFIPIIKDKELVGCKERSVTVYC